jgi:hypothetical protein
LEKNIMRIPINSTFTKEISKKFQRIFNPQTPLEEIQNLQEESYMGSHVDNFIKEVQNKENNNGQKKFQSCKCSTTSSHTKNSDWKKAVSN